MAKDVVDKLETNLSALSSLLGEEVVEDVKKRIGDLIVERVASDIHSYDYYLFYPGNYQASIDEAFEKTNKKITRMYANAMLESAEEAVKRFKDISLAVFDETKGLKLRSCHKCKHCNGNKCKFYEDKKYYWIAHDSICAEEGFINFVEREEKKGAKENVFFTFRE